eukprot:s1701_g3.t1
MGHQSPDKQSDAEANTLLAIKRPKSLKYTHSGGYVTDASAAAQPEGEGEEWVEWSATGLKDASVFDLSPTGTSTQIRDKPPFSASPMNSWIQLGLAMTFATLQTFSDATLRQVGVEHGTPPRRRHCFEWVLAADDTDDPVEDKIYLDAAAFGAGSCCTQATCLCPSLSDARYLYDQLLVLAPLFLPLTGSAPFWRGMVAATDTRMEAFRETWDERTPSEVEQGRPRCSRAATSPQVFLADTGPLLGREADYNDVEATVHQPSLDRLLASGVDQLLATHVAQLFVRDPLNVFRERLEVDNAMVGDHWEQLQSSNWGTVRFKPPPAQSSNPGGQIGWRVELRTPEAQATDFENAAVIAIARVLAQLILEERWDVYQPISKVEENLLRSEGVAAVTRSRFHFRRDFLGGTTSDLGEFSLEEILFGGDGHGVFARCLSFIQRKHEEGACSATTLQRFTKYVELFRRRCAGQLPTPAAWLRQRLAAHKDYAGGSVVPREFVKDMVVLATSLSQQPRSSEATVALSELLGDLAAVPRFGCPAVRGRRRVSPREQHRGCWNPRQGRVFGNACVARSTPLALAGRPTFRTGDGDQWIFSESCLTQHNATWKSTFPSGAHRPRDMGLFDLENFQDAIPPSRPVLSNKAPLNWSAAKARTAAGPETGKSAEAGDSRAPAKQKQADEGPKIPFIFGECLLQPRQRSSKNQSQFVLHNGEEVVCFTS